VGGSIRPVGGSICSVGGSIRSVGGLVSGAGVAGEADEAAAVGVGPG
jgi:hypothetical protein